MQVSEERLNKAVAILTELTQKSHWSDRLDRCMEAARGTADTLENVRQIYNGWWCEYGSQLVYSRHLYDENGRKHRNTISIDKCRCFTKLAF
jgi:hypothetical protein